MQNLCSSLRRLLRSSNLILQLMVTDMMWYGTNGGSAVFVDAGLMVYVSWLPLRTRFFGFKVPHP